MTTNTLAAIRERADEAHSWVYFDIGTETDASTLVDAFATVHTDLQALLAIVDELTRKLEAAEAALREIVEFRASAYRQINDKYYPVEDVGEFLSGKFDDVCEIAADALAAHDANGESAGNGGA